MNLSSPRALTVGLGSLFYVLLLSVSLSGFMGNLKARHQEPALHNHCNDNNNHDEELAPPPEYLLSVPYYVYEEISWINATISDSRRGPFKPVAEVNLHNNVNASLRWMHGDDYWFLKAALEHPMRTRNISEAKLFFVPTLLNHYDFFRHKCVNQLCNGELLEYTIDFLKKSDTFRLFPKQHFIVRSHYKAKFNGGRGELQQNFFQKMIPKMNTLHFENRQIATSPRLSMPSYYVGSPCPGGVVADKTLDFAVIANMKFRSRQTVCNRLHNASEALGIKVVCGSGDRCPALAQAKFGIHLRGDTAGSQRLMDILVSGTIPIFSQANQFEVQGSWIDWNQLSYYVPIHDSYDKRKSIDEEKFIESIKRIKDDQIGFEERQKRVLEHIPFFDMATLYPFDTHMYFIQAQFFMETRHPRSRWSALIMPPVRYTEPP